MGESMISEAPSSAPEGGGEAAAGPVRPWLSSKGILLLLCVFLICMCAIVGLVIYLMMLKGSQLPGGAPAVKEGPDR